MSSSEQLIAAASTATGEELGGFMAGLSADQRARLMKAISEAENGAPPKDAAAPAAAPAAEAAAPAAEKAVQETFGLSEEQITNVRAAFDAADANKSGTIEATELKVIMASLGHELSDEEVGNILKTLDINGDGKLQFDEYLKMVAEALKAFA